MLNYFKLITKYIIKYIYQKKIKQLLLKLTLTILINRIKKIEMNQMKLKEAMNKNKMNH